MHGVFKDFGGEPIYEDFNDENQIDSIPSKLIIKENFNVGKVGKGMLSSVPDIAKVVGKQSGDLAKTIGKQSGDLAKTVGKQTSDLAKAVGKNMDNTLKTVGKKLDDLKKTVQKVKPKQVAMVAAAAGGTALAITSGVNSLEKNGSKYNITDITSLKSGSVAKITYQPSQKIVKGDTVTISNTDTDPVIKGDFTPSKIISDTEIEISLKEPIKKNGTTGNMTLHTDFVNQLRGNTLELVDDVLDTSTSFASDIFSNILSKFGFTPEVIDNIILVVQYVLLAILIIGLLWFLRYVYNLIKSNRKVHPINEDNDDGDDGDNGDNNSDDGDNNGDNRDENDDGDDRRR
jgi:hypothetical protein